jgi:hypothetical protein
MYTTRSSCCLCGGLLKEKFVLCGHPITFSPTSKSHEEDVYEDLKYGSCSGCGSVQLMSLVSQDVLYENSHNGTTYSETWTRHHEEFSGFINVDYTSNVIEVGGTGALSLSADYKILDIVDNGMNNYIKGNCEDFDFCKTNCVIMSHVFEHLYDPYKFIKNCYICGVDDIFISIPSMTTSSKFLPIHTEHTYFADDLDIINLFELNRYKLECTKKFEKHSIFFHFVRNEEVVPRGGNLRPGREVDLFYNFEKRKELIESLSTDDETYIMPGGHFGQVVYYYLKNKEIKGFIDNDKNKQNKRVYGTPFYVFSLNDVNPKNIILYAGAYSSEIQEQIKYIHPTCNVILI